MRDFNTCRCICTGICEFELTDEKSAFKVLSIEELQNQNLMQNPELLDFAARTGETVRIAIDPAVQGAVVQEGVTTILDCGPWLRNFPGGTIRWYKYRYGDLDHTELGIRTLQVPELLNFYRRASITGMSGEIYTIWGMRELFIDEEGIRGVYECEVCIGAGTNSEECHNANATVFNVGRPPIIDVGEGTGEFFKLKHGKQTDFPLFS